MRNSVNIVVIIMLSLYLSNNCHAEQSFVLYPESIDSKTKNYSKEYLEQHFQNYQKKYLDSKLSANYYPPYKLYYYKVNIDEKEKFNSIGLDLEKLKRGGRNIEKLSIFSHLMFIGTIVGIENINDIHSIFRKKVKIEIEEILKGGNLYTSQPKFIYLYDTYGKISVEINGTMHDFFGSHVGLGMDYKLGRKYLIGESFRSEDLENKYSNGNFISNYKIKKKTYCVNKENKLEVDIKNLVDFKDRTNLRRAFFIPYEEIDIIKLRNFIEAYEKINEESKFYNRSYK